MVTATYTPEEKEGWKINEVYQPIFSLERKGDCDTAIKRYESEVIPLAKKSKFETPKSKFSQLAKRGIGNCYMTQRRYEEVERSLEESLKYLPVWPGTDNSDYPLILWEIATTQMAQKNWPAAEGSLKQSVSLFEPQIEQALKSTYEPAARRA